MPSIEKKLEAAEERADRNKRQKDKLVERGMFMGGIFGGAALAAVVDLKFKPILGIQPSVFMGTVGVIAVGMDWVPRKNEDEVLTISLGMLAPTIYAKTKVSVATSGMFGGNDQGGA